MPVFLAIFLLLSPALRSFGHHNAGVVHRQDVGGTTYSRNRPRSQAFPCCEAVSCGSGPGDRACFWPSYDGAKFMALRYAYDDVDSAWNGAAYNDLSCWTTGGGLLAHVHDVPNVGRERARAPLQRPTHHLPSCPTFWRYCSVEPI